MCGIAGIVSLAGRPTDSRSLGRMCDRMARRGPDGSGLWESADGQAMFGHRRLSIIDLHHRSDQPMISESDRYVIVFNGEIYNYEELRGALIAKGRRFRTTSDTEVILALYEDDGEAVVQELRGMFAFAIWDKKENSLFLARDPYGIKPLYFALLGDRFAFASQVQALVAGGVPKEIDSAGLTGFYLFGSVPEPFTIIKRVSALPAGSTLSLRRGKATQRRYASVAKIFAEADRMEFGPPSRADADAIIRESLRSSVRAHLVADVPVGLFLSAGVDSGALLGLMRDVSTQTIQTVTLAFDEFAGSHNDETGLADVAARYFDAEHFTRVVTKEEFGQELPALLAAMDQPTVDGVNSYFVAKATRERGLKVALSGAGGDELFGGYSTFRSIPHDVRIVSMLQRTGLTRAAEKARLMSRNLVRWPFDPKVMELARLGASYAGAYLVRRCVFTPSELPLVLGVDLTREGLERLGAAALVEAELPPGDCSAYARVAALESGLYLKNQLLRDADWASMAHSLEVRLPLVDATLLREAAPVLCQRGTIDKQALALSPTKPLPPAIVARSKTGFSTPLSKWLAIDEQLQRWRDVPALSHPKCKWAKRWAHVVAQEFASR